MSLSSRISRISQLPESVMRSRAPGYLLAGVAALALIGGVTFKVMHQAEAIHDAEARTNPARVADAPKIPPPPPLSSLPPASATAGSRVTTTGAVVTAPAAATVAPSTTTRATAYMPSGTQANAVQPSATTPAATTPGAEILPGARVVPVAPPGAKAKAATGDDPY